MASPRCRSLRCRNPLLAAATVFVTTGSLFMIYFPQRAMDDLTEKRAAALQVSMQPVTSTDAITKILDEVKIGFGNITWEIALMRTGMEKLKARVMLLESAASGKAKPELVPESIRFGEIAEMTGMERPNAHVTILQNGGSGKKQPASVPTKPKCAQAEPGDPFGIIKLPKECPECPDEGSCVRCVEQGRLHWPPGVVGRGNNMFELRKAMYSNSKLDIGFPLVNDSTYINCFSGCTPSFWVPEYEGNTVMEHLNLNATSSQITCEANQYTKFALIMSTNFMDNVYHLVHDVVFTAWITLVQLAQYHNISVRDIAVFSAMGRMTYTEDNPLYVIWDKLLPEYLDLKDLRGCYKSVFYGFMYNARLIHYPTTSRQWLADPVMMTWMSAFSWNHRRAWNAEGTKVKNNEPLLFGKHRRMLDFMEDWPWEDFQGAKIKRVDFMAHRVSKQIKIVMASRGLISVAGAALAWQIWLKPCSAILVISIPHPDIGDCFHMPQTWHETTSIHLGHSAVSWRFCGNASDFRNSGPYSIVDLMLQQNSEAKTAEEGRVCVMLGDWTRNPWPHCDIDFRLKQPCEPLPAWPPYERIGLPFLSHDHLKGTLISASDSTDPDPA